jgi:hypothetical protein
VTRQLGDQFPGSAAIKWRGQLRCGTMGLGHGSSG